MTTSIPARIFDDDDDSYDASLYELPSPTMLPTYQDDDSISNDSFPPVKIGMKNNHWDDIKSSTKEEPTLSVQNKATCTVKEDSLFFEPNTTVARRPKPAKIAHKNRTPPKLAVNKPAATCKICGIKMKSSTALGGHTSKAHPNMSIDFSKRMRIREERTFERSMLQAAKDVFLTLTPGGNINEYRNRVSYLKL